MTRPVNVGVLGAGSWGTTVAALASQNTPTTLWARNPEVAEEIRLEHRNSRYLGERALPAALQASSDIAEVAGSADVLVLGVPSQSLRGVLAQAAPHLRPWVPVISLIKGLEGRERASARRR